MSTRTHHDSPKKNNFIGAVQAGQPLTKAAKELSIPKQTASGIWQKFNKTGSTHIHGPGAHPKSPIISNEQQSMMLNQIVASLLIKSEI